MMRYTNLPLLLLYCLSICSMPVKKVRMQLYKTLLDKPVSWLYVERRKQERREETEARRRTWHERFGERSDSPSAAATDVQEAGRKRAGSLYAYYQFINVSYLSLDSETLYLTEPFHTGMTSNSISEVIMLPNALEI